MNAGHLKKRLRRFRSSCLWIAGWVAAAGSGLALLLATSISQEGPKSAAQVATTTPIAHVSPVVTDPAWDRLSVVQQRTLEPLKGSWLSMTAEQQEKWRLVVDRLQTKPQHVQRRLAARIAEWARLTPQQRAHARLNFLELAKRYNPRQRKEQWQAYQHVKPIEGHAVTGDALPRVLSPVLVQASPGATTVLLSQLFELPSTDDAAEREEAALDPPPIAELSSQSMGAASAAAGNAAELERPLP
jgi:hypothetical protein